MSSIYNTLWIGSWEKWLNQYTHLYSAFEGHIVTVNQIQTGTWWEAVLAQSSDLSLLVYMNSMYLGLGWSGGLYNHPQLWSPADATAKSAYTKWPHVKCENHPIVSCKAVGMCWQIASWVHSVYRSLRHVDCYVIISQNLWHHYKA